MVLYRGPTSKTAGPAATVSSVTVVLQPVRTTYVWPLIGALPSGAVGTVTVKPPVVAVAGAKTGPVTVMKAA